MTTVTIDLPSDLLRAFDRLATIVQYPRCWVIEGAMGAYLEAEGAEIFEDAEALAELDNGAETVSAEEVVAEMRSIIEAGERRRAIKDEQPE